MVSFVNILFEDIEEARYQICLRLRDSLQS